MNVILMICAALSVISSLFNATRQYHMLQLNSYYNMRFLDYLKGAFSPVTAVSALFCAAIAVTAFFSPIICLLLCAVSAVARIFYAVYKHKTAKKKLVFTGRVRRMYATQAVLLIILFCLFHVFGIVALQLLVFFSPFVVMLTNIINSPLENGYKQYYINDAKKILNSYDNLLVIGLTGSYGKTSTKYILGRILSEKYNTVITPGSFNTPMGIVRTVRENLRPDTQIFVCEMGAKNVGDIKEICEIAHPSLGIITSIGPQHLNTFKSIENIIKTKFELADEVCLNNDGKIYLNFDNCYINEKANTDNYDFISYGCNSNSDVHAENVNCSRHGLQFDIVCKSRRISVQTRLLGTHNVLNICACAAVAMDLGLSDTDIQYAISRLEPTEHRLQLKPFMGGGLLIDDAYNANPEGSLEAMRVLGSFAPMKRVAVTPGLVELGEKEYECNKTLGKEAALNSDEIILVGIERSKPLKDGVEQTDFDKSHLHIVKTFNDAVVILRQICDANTVVIFENDLPDNYAK